MTELAETGAELAPVNDAAQPEAKEAPAEVKVVSEEEQRAREEAALDDKLRKVFREAKKTRDEENGRYASKDKPKAKAIPDATEVGSEKAPPTDKAKEPAKAEKTDKQPDAAEKADAKDQKPEEGAEPAAEKAKPAIAQPKSWSAEKKAVWDSMSPEAQEQVSAREQEMHKGISRLGEFAKRVEPLTKLLEQHRDTFQSKGMSYEQGLSQLLAAQRALDTNPVAAIQHLAKAYGVDLGQAADGGLDQADPAVSRLQAQVDSLTQQLQQVQSGAQQRAQAEAQQKLGTIEATIEKFAAGKPDFNDLAPEIEMLLPGLRQANPNAPFEQIINDAYERASWSNPEARQRRLDVDARAKEQARIEAAKKAAEDAKAAGQINVGGQSTANSVEDLDDALRGIYRRGRAA